MKVEFDGVKNQRNITSRGIDFREALLFDFNNALIKQDLRHDYGEVRYIALGFIKSRLHVLVFTEIDHGIRVISLRKANNREVKYYEKATH
ncbi:BrnT family toxin [Bacterioplanoides sp.]|uniref:BrnT family toxin n=1 Tax=Bacterioplanoides sp. TaxID=2066072 RepID=UPI003B007214